MRFQTSTALGLLLGALYATAQVAPPPSERDTLDIDSTAVEAPQASDPVVPRDLETEKTVHVEWKRAHGTSHKSKSSSTKSKSTTKSKALRPEICSPGSCGGGTCSLKGGAKTHPKRDFFENVHNAVERSVESVGKSLHLLKRAVPQPKSSSSRDRNKFVGRLAHPSEGDPNIENIIYWGTAKAEASTSRFRTLGSRPFGIAASQLTGCTVLVVVSERAVWFGHFWESEDFESEYVDPPLKKGEKQKPERLTKPIANPRFTWDKSQKLIGFLHATGKVMNPRHRNVEQGEGLMGRREYLTGSGTAAFILTPESVWKGHEGRPENPRQIERMQNEVERIIGRRPSVQLYDRHDAEERQSTSDANGKALYLYDPGNPKKREAPEQVVWFESKEKRGYAHQPR